MKRFTATDKWGDPWFQELAPEYKCLWVYLCDNCDGAGVWNVNLKLASFQIGYEFEQQAVLSTFRGRVEDLGKGRWWLPKFIAFQYGTLSIDCKPHQHVISLLNSYGLGDRVGKGYGKGMPYPCQRVQEKEKEKEKEIGGCRGGNGKPSPTELILRQKELERVELAIKRIEDSASQDAFGPKLDKEEKSNMRRLKVRRTELIKALGMEA